MPKLLFHYIYVIGLDKFSPSQHIRIDSNVGYHMRFIKNPE